MKHRLLGGLNSPDKSEWCQISRCPKLETHQDGSTPIWQTIKPVWSKQLLYNLADVLMVFQKLLFLVSILYLPILSISIYQREIVYQCSIRKTLALFWGFSRRQDFGNLNRGKQFGPLEEPAEDLQPQPMHVYIYIPLYTCIRVCSGVVYVRIIYIYIHP